MRRAKASKLKGNKEEPIIRAKRAFGALRVRNPVPMPYLCTGVLRVKSKVDCWSCPCGWTCDLRAETNFMEVTRLHGPQGLLNFKDRVSMKRHNSLVLKHRITRDFSWELWSCTDCRWADIVRPYTSRNTHRCAAEQSLWNGAANAPKLYQPSASEVASLRRKRAFELGLPMPGTVSAKAPQKPGTEHKRQAQSKSEISRQLPRVPASNPGPLGSPSTVCRSCGGPILTDGRCRCS